jgi:hypothetical protein
MNHSVLSFIPRTRNQKEKLPPAVASYHKPKLPFQKQLAEVAVVEPQVALHQLSVVRHRFHLTQPAVSLSTAQTKTVV